MPFSLDPDDVRRAFSILGERLATLAARVDGLPISPGGGVPGPDRTGPVSTAVEIPRDPPLAQGPEGPLTALLDPTMAALDGGMIQVTARRYFGLFNPAPTAASVLADALVAAYNPQLATTQSAPYLVAAETVILDAMAERLRMPGAEGTFTSGGAEANASALVLALQRAFPDLRKKGLRGVDADPRVYVSTEGHDTFAKAVVAHGLGEEALRTVAADGAQRMRPEALSAAMVEDVRAGRRPVLVVGTLGTTTSGAIDPLVTLGRMAQKHRAWFHVDAAYGGILALAPEGAPYLTGLEAADSITCDAHKVLHAPMAAGMLFVKHRGLLGDAFRVPASYMPRRSSDDPFSRSLQWSRRSMGLKVLLPLQLFGWEGFREITEGLFALGRTLRAALTAAGLTVVNDTPLPIACITHAKGGPGLEAMRRSALVRANAWTSLGRLSSGTRVLRACVTNHRTDPSDVAALVEALREGHDEALAETAG